MFINLKLESKLIEKNQMVALEMPLKILVYKESEDENASYWDDIEYIESKYNVTYSDKVKSWYRKVFKQVSTGIDKKEIASFKNNKIDSDSIKTFNSKMTFDETVKKCVDLVSENDDVQFKVTDYRKLMKKTRLKLPKMKLIMYGAPAPGGKVMNGGQTMGLDGFPQKILIWEDNGQVKMAYNDLLVLSDRQDTSKGLAIRVVQYRINSTFEPVFQEIEQDEVMAH